MRGTLKKSRLPGDLAGDSRENIHENMKEE